MYPKMRMITICFSSYSTTTVTQLIVAECVLTIRRNNWKRLLHDSSNQHNRISNQMQRELLQQYYKTTNNIPVQQLRANTTTTYVITLLAVWITSSVSLSIHVVQVCAAFE